jgi:hypothetical protein
MTEEQEGKSLDELAGKGHIATPGAVHDWLEKYQGKSVKELLENTPTTVSAEYDHATKVLTIKPSLPTEEEIMKPVDFKEGCFGMRSDIELVKSKCKNWMEHPEILSRENSRKPLNKKAEMIANLKLAYRHLEDARMRLGKAVQAYDGGKSCYPR